MSHFKTRMTSLLLVFGIFFTLSCATVNQEDRPSGDLTSQEELEQRLSDINAQLSENPANSSLNLERAGLLKSLAQITTPPSSRLPLYKELRDIDNSGVIEGQDLEPFHEMIKQAWSHEQNEAVKLLQLEEISESEAEHEQAVDHLQNAVTVNPDSLTTYHLLANSHYRKGNFRSAIETLDRAKQASGADEIELMEKIAYLKLESGDLESAVNNYRTLADFRPENANILHGLANAYMLNNQHHEAVEVLHGFDWSTSQQN
jgi:tetratricopeptide (TPR) repeat protein